MQKQNTKHCVQEELPNIGSLGDVRYLHDFVTFPIKDQALGKARLMKFKLSQWG